jgi:hypothetical protein
MTDMPADNGAPRPRPLTAEPDPLLAAPETEVLSETGRERETAGQTSTAVDVGLATGEGNGQPGATDRGATDKAAAVAGEAADGAKQVAGQAAQSGAEVAATAAEDARSVVSTAGEEARSVAQDAAGHARHLISETQSELRQQAESQAERLAGSLGDVSSQLESLLGSSPAQEGVVADLVKEAAGRTEVWADKVRQGGLDGLLADTKRFARNRPGLFLLGALGAGLAVGRIARNADTSAIVDAAKQAASPESDSNQEVLGSGTAQMTASSGPLAGGSIPGGGVAGGGVAGGGVPSASPELGG